MTGDPSFRLARTLALAAPALLLGGAYVGQYGFGLPPCEMCWWQRWAHFAAIGLALLAHVAPGRRALVALAAGAILVSGAIGAYHAGVEYDWWEGLTRCASAPGAGRGDPLGAILEAPLTRCDEAPFALAGISLAGFNFLLSTAAGVAILHLLGKRA